MLQYYSFECVESRMGEVFLMNICFLVFYFEKRSISVGFDELFTFIHPAFEAVRVVKNSTAKMYFHFFASHKLLRI